MMQKIRSFLADNANILSALNDSKEILAFLVIIIGGVWVAFTGTSDLEVTYEQTPLRIPEEKKESIISLNKSTDYLKTKLTDSLSISHLNNIENINNQYSRFSQNTLFYVTITLKNNKSEVLNNVIVKITGVRDFTGIGVAGDIFTEKELKSIINNAEFDKYSGIVQLPVISKITPKSELTLYVWGNIYPTQFFENPVIVLYDGGIGKIVQISKVKGVQAFIYENSVPIFIIIVFINIIALLIRSKKES